MNIHSMKRKCFTSLIKQRQKLYFDELVLILFDAVYKSPGFLRNIEVFNIDIQVLGLQDLRGAAGLFRGWRMTSDGRRVTGCG